jgi:hypothetical protein
MPRGAQRGRGRFIRPNRASSANMARTLRPRRAAAQGTRPTAGRCATPSRTVRQGRPSSSSARAAWRLIDLKVAPKNATFSFALNRDKLRSARRRQGCYLPHRPSSPLSQNTSHRSLYARRRAF